MNRGYLKARLRTHGEAHDIHEEIHFPRKNIWGNHWPIGAEKSQEFYWESVYRTRPRLLEYSAMEATQVNTNIEPNYGILQDVCKLFGISRTQAFAYSKAGLLDTFLMNNRRYVYIDSVRSLPVRLQSSQHPKILASEKNHPATRVQEITELSNFRTTMISTVWTISQRQIFT